ncbi:MAG: MBL fold metallo-hydrolase [Anaerolineae bacterium]|jgi:7,8-dihydropterin-6-yl-methyl-4-(beta-D-ribofuranosyl)aminobenzene 5'-phosphate synthase|nr:MBL fold metallo-hydrolase [Anaerolineae bacterium]
MQPSITCVVDNAVKSSSHLWGEHGLAFWVETESGPVLLDTGQSGAVLLHNLDELHLDASRLKALALSHAHYDHTGGLPALAGRLTPGLPLYANSDLLQERFSQSTGQRRAIGLSVLADWLAAHFDVHLDDAPQQVLPGVWTTGAITERPYPGGYVPRQEIRAGDGYAPDPYRDDLSLVVESDSGLIVLCGCCHAGLLNTLEHVQRVFRRHVVAVAGGTHLISADAATLQLVAQKLTEWGGLQRLYLNHCSGQEAYFTLRQALGGAIVRPCPAGAVLEWATLA